MKSSHGSYGLDKTAKELAEEYFHSQRSLNPPRRADAGFMRKRLEGGKDSCKDPNDPTGSRYLLDYAQFLSEKQLSSLFARLEKSRQKGLIRIALREPTT